MGGSSRPDCTGTFEGNVGMTQKIYLVSVGDEGDGGIFASYSDRGEAARNALLIDGNVQEMELDSHILEDPGLDFFVFTIHQNGLIVGSLGKRSRLDDGARSWRSLGDRRKVAWEFIDDGPGKWRILCRTYAQSEEHARQQADSIRLRVLSGERPRCVHFGTFQAGRHDKTVRAHLRDNQDG